jgi:hypothetical protein
VRLVGAMSLAWFLAACGQESVQPTESPVSSPHRLGDLEIVTTRSGSGVDSDGYELTIDGVVFARMVAEDTLLLISAPVGMYWIGLTGVAPDCKVGGGNPRGVRVDPSVTTRAIFVVKCDPPATTPGS